MVVNSLDFLLFFIIVFAVYYIPPVRRNAKFQNLWILLASYFFYGVADWKMLPLLLGSTAVFYFLGIWLKSKMNQSDVRRASWIKVLGVVLGVGILLYFKYLNFFADSFAKLLTAMGFQATWTTLNIVLPIGVSFFTFRLISYVIEIHREHIVPCKSFIDFATYISFFPTILSGPIDRPNTFLPQLCEPHSFDFKMAIDGCRQILWGMFTKMCIADKLANHTDAIWAYYHLQSSSTLIITALLYFIQMYADFDGYSNMAIGVGKLLGFKITRNFNHPLLARNVAEYWCRWHMSLTSWITDYVFMPLNVSFRNLGKLGVILATTINLTLIGLWHGANWTYGVFGLYHSLLMIPLILLGIKNKKIKANDRNLPKIGDLAKMVLTFCLVSIGLIIFRAPSLTDAFAYIGGIFSTSVFSIPTFSVEKKVIIPVLLLFVLEWFQRDKEHPLQVNSGIIEKKWYVSYLFDMTMIAIVILFGNFESSQFIYFQF